MLEGIEGKQHRGHHTDPGSGVEHDLLEGQTASIGDPVILFLDDPTIYQIEAILLVLGDQPLVAPFLQVLAMTGDIALEDVTVERRAKTNRVTPEVTS